jgi:hypothetical protein
MLSPCLAELHRDALMPHDGSQSTLDLAPERPSFITFRCGVWSEGPNALALHAGLQLAARTETEGKAFVVLLADTAERYVMTALFPKVT